MKVLDRIKIRKYFTIFFNSIFHIKKNNYTVLIKCNFNLFIKLNYIIY